MRNFLLLIFLSLLVSCATRIKIENTNTIMGSYEYEANKLQPYGRIHPDAPEQLKDFAALIGESNCKSTSRNPDQSWADEVAMLWRFKYIMNGMAIQDETLKADGAHSGSIRQYDPENDTWNVHYYSSSSQVVTLPAWQGNKNEDGNIILYRDQTAPNGMEGKYRLTFSDISATGFEWVGEWVNSDESIVYPTWKISCVKKI